MWKIRMKNLIFLWNNFFAQLSDSKLQIHPIPSIFIKTTFRIRSNNDYFHNFYLRTFKRKHTHSCFTLNKRSWSWRLWSTPRLGQNLCAGTGFCCLPWPPVASRGLQLTMGRAIHIVPKCQVRHWGQKSDVKVFRP